MAIKNFFDGGKQISDSTSGLPLSGGKCYFYEPGTTTPKNTYTTYALSVANANPVILDSGGRANIWLNGNYRVIVKDSSDNTVYDEDNINPETTTTVTSIVGSQTLGVSDKGKILEVNGSGITLTLTAAATLGAGWYVDYISTDSSNSFTFGRANSGNSINGATANLTVYPLQAGRIWVNNAANGFITEGDLTMRGVNPQMGDQVRNLRINITKAGNAYTIAFKTNDGNDPSVADPIYIPFRNVTATTGDLAHRRIAAATSLTISSGSTLGTTDNTPHRVWIVGVDDGGTVRPGVINCSTSTTIYALKDDSIVSTTAEGGAGGADSAGVIYTGTAVTSKSMRVLGYFESTQTTAGTWAADHTKIQLWTPGMKLPGDFVQYAFQELTTSATGTTTIPMDDTIPQSTEGDQYQTVSITPTSSINHLSIVNTAFVGHSATVYIIMALFQDATANALAAVAMANNAGETLTFPLRHGMVAGTASATTFKIRIGGSSAGTTIFNGQGGAQKFGGRAASLLQVMEIMA